MKITDDHDTLRVSEVQGFTGLEVDDLIRDLHLALQPKHSSIELDLARIRSADCDTVDALLTIYEEFDRGDVARAWRIINPPSELRQLLELVRLHHLFEITPPRPSRMILL